MSKKHKKRLIRIIIAAVLTAVIIFLPIKNNRLSLALYALPYLICGSDVVLSAFRNIIHGRVFDEKFLMTVATFGAAALGDYKEAVAVMLFYQIGELFQGIAVGKSRKNIAALMDIKPETATVLRDGNEITVSPDEVKTGELIVVRPGEKIPLDGVITDGATTVGTAALTGESMPTDKTAGQKVISGSVNLSGVITVKTESEYHNSTVAKILELVENSSSKKAKTENFITRFAKYYTPAIVFSALALAFIPPLFTDGNRFKWIERALIFLVVSCPCALVISVPLSFFGGIGGASKKGVLIKGANYLEILAKVGTVVFDKTGTLTKGNFKVTAVHPENITEEELIDIAAAAEIYSNHPIADAIINAGKGRIDSSRISSVKEHSGMGIEAVIDQKKVFVGNGKLMDFAGSNWHDCHKIGTVIHISKENEYLGHIVITDEIKSDSAPTVSGLKKMGIKKTVMLTGDRREIAEFVGKETGIDEVKAELMPDAKVKAVEELMKTGTPLAFVGDGINDAPVLARADVSVAMGAMGSDAAIEAADIVLMDDSPHKLITAINISKKTLKIVKQNIVFALAVKIGVLILGALGFANMWFAVFADVGVSVLAIINAMRAMKIK